MSLQVSLLNIFACILVLALLSACQKSPSGAVIVQTPPDGPKEVVVTSEPVPEPEPQLPAQPSEIPINRIPTNVLLRDEPQVIVIPESKPAEDPYAECIEECSSSCSISAKYACAKPTGVECKSACGQIIVPSACSTACSLRHAGVCEPKFIEFCTAQCVGKCH